jgi:hypothetical protein
LYSFVAKRAGVVPRGAASITASSPGFGRLSTVWPGPFASSRIVNASVLSDGSKWHAILEFIAFRPQEPKRETTRVVVHSWPACWTRNSGADAQGAFAAGLLPSASFHDHSHDHANNLTQAFRLLRVLFTEELIHGTERFQFADDARQGGTIMVDFRFFHASLTAIVFKECEDLIERLRIVVEHVRKRPALPVLEEILSRDPDIRHCPVLLISAKRRFQIPIVQVQTLHLQQMLSR